ncbi:sugar kinase [Treponema parvum]|uniref:Sugar kinase n=1 Tax=Treponema parvum TaxID=138851 RepID=A0A975F2T8_9SPIR|nr:sugar kinase [Treponema parvum]QTQ13595.1 sugar kinase [Treponema parvum]
MNNKKRIVTFGEVLLRFNPTGYERLLQASNWKASYSGAEANVAVSLANFDQEVFLVTKVPSHDIGQCAVNWLRHYGVHMSKCARGGDRLGIYFIEKGASQRPSKVIYDRKDSAFSLSKPEDYDWNEILSNAGWFHFTGITPAVGGSLPEICLEACKTAKKLGLTISCDLNFRRKLWSAEQAQKTMLLLLPYVDVFISNMSDVCEIFGILPETCDIETAILNREGPTSVSRQLVEKFGFGKVALTLRKSISADINDWGGMIYDGEKKEGTFSPRYSITMIDRVGGGDAFSAGIIYSLITGMPVQEGIDFAVASSCLKHTIENDFNLASVDEVKSLSAGNSSGRVQR